MSENTSRQTFSRRALLWLMALLLAFLLGFIPQYRAARQARGELAQTRSRLAEAEQRVEQAKLRDLIALVYLDVSQKNYGLAAQRSTTFFDKAAELASSPADARLSGVLREVLSARDNVTAGLAAGDPAVASEIQRLLRVIFEATGA